MSSFQWCPSTNNVHVHLSHIPKLPVCSVQLHVEIDSVYTRMHSRLNALLIADLMANISLNNYRLPSSEDLPGAVTALRRLQDTYQVKSSDLANALLGKEESLDMSG